mgnify:CR=1 FL=1
MSEQEITIGKVYKHYKGNLYKIIAFAKHSETEEDMIVYQPLKTGDNWVRPRRMWNEIVNNNGTLRFTLQN